MYAIVEQVFLEILNFLGKGLFVVIIFMASVVVLKNRNYKKVKPSLKKVVCITGCDSGLGFSIAQHTSDIGFTVFAGFLSLESKGAKEIRQKYGEKIIQMQLDITDINSVKAVVETVEQFLISNSGYSLHAVINNAAVMVFGEFEWLTEKLIHQQINVNLLGTLKFTHAFCPLLRSHKGRVIIVTSHCSQVTLPGLAVYGATKAALSAFSDGLRVEMIKYGVNVTTLIPGSFALSSNIMARQQQYAEEMHGSFTPEQHAFYDEYFKEYNGYLSFITSPLTPIKLDDPTLYKEYEKSLLDKKPKFVYKTENWRYWFYHTLIRFGPWFLWDYFVLNFITMPKYKQR